MTVLWRALHFALCLLNCVIYVEQAIYGIRILQFNATLDPEYGDVSAYIVDKSMNLDFNLVKTIDNLFFYVTTTERNRKQLKTWVNSTFKSCELRNQMKGNPILYFAHDMIRKYSNITIACRYPPGFYSLRNFRPGTSGMPLTFIYRPNSQVTTNLTLFDGNGTNPFGNVLTIMKVIKA